MSLRVTFILLLLILAPQGLPGAACCGGGAQVPGLILTDDVSQWELSTRLGQVTADTSPGGQLLPRGSGDQESSQKWAFSAAASLTPRTQIALEIPWGRRMRSLQQKALSEWGLGDLSLALHYELLPEWVYSPWRPKIFVTLAVLLPTGTSIYDSTATWGLDVLGSGFFTPSLGAVALKTWGDWDASLGLNLSYPLARTAQSPLLGNTQVTPQMGASATLALGFSPPQTKMRWGMSLMYSHQGGVEREGFLKTPSRTSMLALLQLGYLFTETWSFTAVYQEPSLQLHARNFTLERALTLRIQNRFPP